MSRSMPFTSRALGLVALVFAASVCAAAADEAVQTPVRRRARVYTNADLERVHPFAAQTGADSVPAAPADAQPVAEREREREPATRGRGEDYWRREAAAVRERLRDLEERAAGLRTRIAERERAPRDETVYGSRKRSSPQSTSVSSLLASLSALERRMQRTKEDLEDRARRDGALPGWLR